MGILSENGMSLLVECQDCGKKFEVSSKDEIIQHKKEFKVNEQSIFLTYYDCPDCGRRHCVQVDTIQTLQELKEVERMFIKLSVAKKKGKQPPQSQSAKFKKAREHLAQSRIDLMKQFTGKLVHDSETDTDIVLEFSA
jgi:DNA-directed RNA polymerase subunit RPC12/RpoP